MSDQHFHPGDKVMLVQHVRDKFVVAKPDYPKVEFGTVYCVDFCYFNPSTERNRVGLVGWPRLYHCNGILRGFPAIAFRKVEEIRLCIQATQAHDLTVAEAK